MTKEISEFQKDEFLRWVHKVGGIRKAAELLGGLHYTTVRHWVIGKAKINPTAELLIKRYLSGETS